MLGGLLAAAVGLASAAPVTGQISLNGYARAVGSVGMGAATGLDFANGTGTSVSGSFGAVSSYGSGSGSFAAFGACFTGACGTIKDIASFASSAPINLFISLSGGPALYFDLASITSASTNSTTNSLSLTATGTIHFAGLDDTAGTFYLTAQGDNINAYSATLLASPSTQTNPTPEPATLALVAAGLAAARMARHARPRRAA